MEAAPKSSATTSKEESGYVCERERVRVCVKERECVCEREIVSERVSRQEKERGVKDRVCERSKESCEREREGES